MRPHPNNAIHGHDILHGILAAVFHMAITHRTQRQRECFLPILQLQSHELSALLNSRRDASPRVYLAKFNPMVVREVKGIPIWGSRNIIWRNNHIRVIHRL